MSKQAVESVERKLRALGKGPLAVTSLVSDSRRMYNDGDYVKALATAIRPSDAIADLRILLEEVQDVRTRAQGLLQTAYEVGAIRRSSRSSSRKGRLRSKRARSNARNPPSRGVSIGGS